MQAWLAENWWWLLPTAGLIPWMAWVRIRVRRRGGDEAFPVRVLFTLFPLLDAKSKVRREFPPHKLAVLAILSLAFVTVFAYLFFI